MYNAHQLFEAKNREKKFLMQKNWEKFGSILHGLTENRFIYIAGLARYFERLCDIDGKVTLHKYICV